MEKKRADVPRAAPVAHAGVRYEVVPRGGLDRGLEPAGYVAAVDEQTGRELWVVKVYDVTYDPGMEGDKQDVVITGLAVADGRLVVTNERGQRFEVTLSDRSVRGL